jgi:hypothetical protein
MSARYTVAAGNPPASPVADVVSAGGKREVGTLVLFPSVFLGAQ